MSTNSEEPTRSKGAARNEELANGEESGSSAPIGVFDSGYGGLTVLREIEKSLPSESTVFIGDSAHFPYGPKDKSDLERYVLAICDHLVGRGCKLIVIACNTATAAGLASAQRAFDVPVIGVVEPGARAAVHMTRNRRVGIIATEGTVASGAYERAIRNLDAGIDVWSVAAPRFVDIAEAGLQFSVSVEESAGGDGVEGEGGSSLIVSDRGILDSEAGELYRSIAQEYLCGLKSAGIDTLVLGCTHFPLIQPLIQDCMGPGVMLVSSAEETAREAREVLGRRGQLAPDDAVPIHEYFTTGESLSEFDSFGQLVMGSKLGSVSHLGIWEEG